MPENNLLRRRNHRDVSSSTSSAATTAASSATSSGSSQTDEFELFSIKPVNYTSLKDLLPAAAAGDGGVNSPGSEILIRNRLVKQAAWAYLQPMSASPVSGGRSFLRRLCARFSGESSAAAAILDFVDSHVIVPLTRAVDWLLRAIGIRRFG